MNWLDYVQNRLLEMQPASIYAFEESALQLVTRILPKTPVSTPAEAPTPPCTLAVGVNALKGLSVNRAQQLISNTRIYIAPRLLLVEGAECALNAEAFRALGFSLCFYDDTENLSVYDYDLATYKPVPDWLNARYWAHPERWKP